MPDSVRKLRSPMLSTPKFGNAWAASTEVPSRPVVPEIAGNTPGLADTGDPVKNYLAINRDLRKTNNEALAELSAKSQHRFLWSKAFQQLGSSQVEASVPSPPSAAGAAGPSP